MPDNRNAILNQMLDRLFASIVRGPSIDCRPANSRQRLDIFELAALKDQGPFEIIKGLMSESGTVKLTAQVERPAAKEKAAERTEAGRATESDPSDAPTNDASPENGEQSGSDSRTPEETAQQKAWRRQQSVIRKLRHIAEEARTYEEDTGVYVLNIGFPLLHIPKHASNGGPRILAPLAFLPVQLSVSGGTKPTVEMKCRYSGEDRLVPNESLFAWVEKQTGRSADDLFADEEGTDPWRELSEICLHVCTALELEPPAWATLAGEDSAAIEQALTEEFGSAPRTDESSSKPAVHDSAVLGLYPLSNQGLLRDTQQMAAAEEFAEPLSSFLSASTTAPTEEAEEEVERRKRVFAEERFVQHADPCQGRAVRLAREVRGLVVHGPPGTGKSQTIANIIGDHLSRGERVLFVCEKRTALDVVATRLQHIGLGDLCALIHDPKRDQRDLYMGIRKQLEELTDTQPDPKAAKRVAEIDKQLQKLHEELLLAWRTLMIDNADADSDGIPDVERAGQEGSFHDLVGRWLGIDEAVELPRDLLTDTTEEELRDAELAIQNILERGVEATYGDNPWPATAGITIDELLDRPADEIRAQLAECLTAAETADKTLVDGLPPFKPEPDPRGQARARSELADRLEAAISSIPEETLGFWADADESRLSQATPLLATAAPMADLLRDAAPDAEIEIVLAGETRTAQEIASDIGALTAYQAISSKWWSFLAFGPRGKANAVVSRYGVPCDENGVGRVLRALQAKRAALVLLACLDQLGWTTADNSPAGLTASFTQHRSVVELLLSISQSQDQADGDIIRGVLRGERDGPEAVNILRAAQRRADAIAALLSACQQTGLFSNDWLRSCTEKLCGHEHAAEVFALLSDRLPTLEEVLRIESGLADLPPGMRTATRAILDQAIEPAKGIASLLRAMLTDQIASRLRESKVMQRLDGKRVEAAFERIGKLQQEKMGLVRTIIRSRWVGLQRERLLASTGTRLNSAGADVKRRLYTRGQRALRLRQVINHGRGAEGGDPLFDLRPVWMASPETVAQVFPREAMFDVVIFDEASQCRLEEALPVLTRAKRVVIAGDPKQLPPTRFFESAVIASEQREIESDQELFEIQQSEVEDLLGAALNLEIEHAYLDVHYRSQNADLISFSNEQFYSSRLQAIPGHPKNRTRFAPLQLIHAEGVYGDGQNPIEADRVVQVVRDLLRHAEPPSIGIASFNVAQRDLIIDKLDEAAEADPAFSKRLATARARRGAGSFEGLFVKNLENVQGDERDHIIISTTYGPNEEGRFYRRFGPLIQAGGGRRLNVLVTRARQEVHLVTSIPPDQYRALPPIPEGQTPSGGWLLFAYLNYAEILAELYEQAHEEREAARTAEERSVRARETESPSRLAESLARVTGKRGHGSEVYWGNDGFCVDIALDHPVRPDDVTIGVQVDMTRFRGAADPVEWEFFRSLVLASQGWTIRRVWSPTIFRDLTGIGDSIDGSVQDFLLQEQDPDAIQTWDDPANGGEQSDSVE